MSQSRTPCPHCDREPGTPHALLCPRSLPSLRRSVEFELAKRGDRLPEGQCSKSYRTLLYGRGKSR